MYKVHRLHHLTDKINKFNIVIRGVSYAHIDCRWNFSDNKYPHNAMYFIRSGGAVLNIGGYDYKLKPGYVYLIPANTLFSAKCPDRMSKLYICANVFNEYHLDIFSDLEMPMIMPFSCSDLNKLLYLIHNQTPHNLLRLKSEINLIIADFIEKAITEHDLHFISSVDHKYYSIMKYINDNLSVQLRAGDIAKKFRYTPESLSRDFKNAVGMSIKKYIDQVIIQKAQQLLLSSELTIQQISDTLGFNDRNHFSKYFKQKSKISPSDYRRCNRTE